MNTSRSRARVVITAATVAGLAVSFLVATGAQASPTAADGVTANASSAGCGRAPTLTSGTHTIQSSGRSRSFMQRGQPAVPTATRLALTTG